MLNVFNPAIPGIVLNVSEVVSNGDKVVLGHLLAYWAFGEK